MAKIVDIIEDGIVYIGKGVVSLVDSTLHAIGVIWREAVMPILEEVFSWIGIVDEYVISAFRVSTKLIDDGSDHYRTALIRGVLSNVRNDATFYQNYVYEITRARSQIRTQYLLTKSGRFVHNLPQMSIIGGNVDDTAVLAALDSAIGGTNTVLSVDSYVPTPVLYFRNHLQSSPYLYKAHLNTLTYDNQYGQSFDDWEFDSSEYNDISGEYDLTISRSAVNAVFWITGQDQIVEGDTANYVIKCNRVVPAGSTITVTLSYGGTAVSGTDYTEQLTVDILENTSETLLSIPITENVIADGNKTLIVNLVSVDNTLQVFESLTIPPQDSSVTTSITDDDSLILTMSNTTVGEDAVSVTVPVKLEAATSAFTVDFTLTNITATKGTDYENTSGTLNFSGVAGETVDIVVGITADILDDDYEQFQISLTNCSDPAVDITQVSVVTIVDGTDVIHTPSNVTDTVVFSLPEYDKERTLMVRYRPSGSPVEEWKYWFYEYDDGTYLGVEHTADIITGLEILPVIMLRTDKVNVNADKTSAEYKLTRTLIRVLGLNIDDLIETLESNENIEFIDDALINFGISPSDDSPALSKMMFLMWDTIINTHSINSNVNKYHASYKVDDIISNSVAWTDQSYAQSLPTVQTYDVGTFRHEIDGEDLVIYKQIAPNAASVIRVVNLKSLSAVNAEINGQEHHKLAVSSVELPDFTIPVSWYMLKQLDYKEFLEAFPLILRLDCYAAQETEIAWYATEDFQIVLRIIQVVLTIYFWYAGGGTWAELAYEIITQVVIAEIIVLATEVILEITGNEDLALVVGLVASVLVSGNGSLDVSLLDPERLVEISTHFANNIGSIQDILHNDFMEKTADTFEALDTRDEDLLEAKNTLNTPIVAEFLAHTNSPDYNHSVAITAQFNYDYIYNYDSLIRDYYDNKLRLGVL